MESVSNNNVVTGVPPTVVQVESEERRPSAGGLTTDLSAVAQARPDPAPLGEGHAPAVLRSNVAARAASGTEWAATVEKVKQEVWQAVRDGVAAGHDMNTPASFLALDEEGKKQVVQLTVNWVFTPVNEETENRFNRFTSNGDVRLSKGHGFRGNGKRGTQNPGIDKRPRWDLLLRHASREFEPKRDDRLGAEFHTGKNDSSRPYKIWRAARRRDITYECRIAFGNWCGQ